MKDYVIYTTGGWATSMLSKLLEHGLDAEPVGKRGIVVFDTTRGDIRQALYGFGGYSIAEVGEKLSRFKD